MLIEKSVTMNSKKVVVSASKYECDMCKKPLKKSQRILVSTSEIGKDKPTKKWDLCENCMHIIEKNVDLWYNKIVSK